MFVNPGSAFVGCPSVVCSASGSAKKARYARLLPSTRKSSDPFAGPSSSCSSSPVSVLGLTRRAYPTMGGNHVGPGALVIRVAGDRPPLASGPTTPASRRHGRRIDGPRGTTRLLQADDARPSLRRTHPTPTVVYVGAMIGAVTTTSVSIVPFVDEHLDGAAVLLAERHRAQRRVEPGLDPAYEEPAAARREIEALARDSTASGVAAVVD